MSSTSALRFESGLDDTVELARAEVYGVLSRLWWAPADAALLQQFAQAPTEAPRPGAFLEEPWRALVGILRQTTPEQAAAEYDGLFLGVSKPEVFLYGSYYVSGFLNETPLVALRHELQALGLERDPAMGETEDHVALVCEVMRYLIAGDDVALCNLERQRRFFRAHLQPWVERMCDAVEAHPEARVYGALACFTRAFLQVESQALDMLDE